MKTLYESILDSDAQDKIEHRASAHVNKKKLLAEILDKLQDLISVLNFKYEAAWSIADSKHSLGLTENVILYDFDAKYRSKTGDQLKKIKSGMRKTFMDHKYACDIIPDDTKKDMYIFAPVGVTISIGRQAEVVRLMIHINKDDQDAKDIVNEFAEKYNNRK